MPMIITSSSFKHKEEIPARYTCDGPNVSPPLEWFGLPVGTKSLALVVEDPDAPDPDAPRSTWVHWVLYDMPPDINILPEGSIAEKLEPKIKQGLNDWKHVGYQGPCPPKGKHRYFFKLYALDTLLTLDAGASKKQVVDAMKGHILSQAQLVGKYRRK